jgi:hypothetical protein
MSIYIIINVEVTVFLKLGHITDILAFIYAYV